MDPIEEKDTVVQDALRRLCHGLPVSELKLMVEESTACEEQLLKEIALLERALKDADEDMPRDPATTAAVDAILENPLTPLHQYWTASALLGRLRNELALPTLDSLQLPAVTSSTSSSPTAGEELALQGLLKQTEMASIYGKQTLPAQSMLVVWKKISSNRGAGVFRRAVKPEEAPGYTDRISFPMDLGLVRKRIVSGNIQTLADLHGAIALISHNCVKYNGRESDYGRVAVEFEAMADQVILQAVQQQQQQANAGTASASSIDQAATVEGAKPDTSQSSVAATGTKIK